MQTKRRTDLVRLFNFHLVLRLIHPDLIGTRNDSNNINADDLRVHLLQVVVGAASSAFLPMDLHLNSRFQL